MKTFLNTILFNMTFLRVLRIQWLSLYILVFMCTCTSKQNEAMDQNNIMLAEWEGQYEGTPAFDKMNLKDVKPALEQAMALHLKEIDQIAGNSEAPTFENTIVELERSGTAIRRVLTYYGILSSNMSTEEFRQIRTEMEPILAEYRSTISQNKALFNRIKTVYETMQDLSLDEDKKRVLQLTYERFAMNGAELEGKAKERYAAINKELSELYTSFSNNVLADEEGYITYITEDQLSGLSQSFIKAAAATATENGQEGKFAITNTRSVVEPFLTFSDERELREQIWKTYKSRGDNGDEKDNNQIISKIMNLRHERVGLLGYENYATWRLQNRMAKKPENVYYLLEELWGAATARVQEEVADMQKIAGNEITIRPWDYLYYAEKVRKAKYDLDSDEIKQYLQLEKLREAMFFVASEVFNFTFSPIPAGSVPVFHEDVKVYEVTNKSTGEYVGLWYLDPFARKGKRSGAWANTYRRHSSFDGVKTVLSSNNSNFIKPAEGDPALVSWSDAETLFHEFGHALNALCSNVTYPSLNSMVWDYVEFQSQLLERWLFTDKVIDQFFRHNQTGEPMPKELVEKIRKAATFNQGYETAEYLVSALVDMKYHTMQDPSGLDVVSFEEKVLKELKMPQQIAMRHRSAHFSHIFSGEGYAAAYYAYIWADVLTSDAAEAFSEAPGGFYDKEVAEKLVKYMFAPCNTIEPADAFKIFRGRDPKIDALKRDRGFPMN